MWHRLKNFFQGLTTYPILSPDLRTRRQVYQWLRQRPTLSLGDWYVVHGKPSNLSYAIIEFAYQRLADYSGLEFGRMLPSDRLNEDLCWTKICWFDWHMALCDDFCQWFGVDLSNEILSLPETTIGALLKFLEDHRKHPHSHHHSTYS
jgi:hypothetical protein